MVSVRFLLQNSQKRIWFFEKTFLLTDASIEMILKMPFLFLNNADIKFAELRKLSWRLYIAAEALPTINWVELINKKEFTKVALNENPETFVVYIAALEVLTTIPIHFSKTYQMQDNHTLAIL